uniref:TENS3 n=1 Tax=Mesocestoides corti TaxID=53468 RepID=A0A5K3EH59_MESCO
STPSPPLFLGLVLSPLENGLITVAWFEPVFVENLAECCACVVVHQSHQKFYEESRQPDQFIFASQVKKHAMSADTHFELALPEPQHPVLRNFLEKVLSEDELLEVVLDDSEKSQATRGSVTEVSSPILLSLHQSDSTASSPVDMLNKKAAEAIQALQQPAQSKCFTQAFFGPIIMSSPGEISTSQELPLKASCFLTQGLLSSFTHLPDVVSVCDGVNLSPPHEANFLSAPQGITVVTDGVTNVRSPDSIQHSQIVALDAVIPGFIPPFDTRAGSQSQPSTTAFDPEGIQSQMKAKADKGKQNICLWLSPNGS